MSRSPWLAPPPPPPPAPPTGREGEEALSTPGPGVRVWSPVGEVDDTLALPTRYVTTGAPLWVCGAHGGAGATTLATLLGVPDSGVAWPCLPGSTLSVVVAARTHAYGIKRAHEAALQWAAGGVPGVQLAGVVWIPDQAGRLPKPLKEPLALASGAFPYASLMPWQPAWRLQQPTDVAMDKALAKHLAWLINMTDQPR